MNLHTSDKIDSIYACAQPHELCICHGNNNKAAHKLKKNNTQKALNNVSTNNNVIKKKLINIYGKNHSKENKFDV